jgi:hypothetical protein
VAVSEGLRILGTGVDYATRRPLFPIVSADEFVDKLRVDADSKADELGEFARDAEYASTVRGDRPRLPTPDIADPTKVGWSFVVSEDDPLRDQNVAALRDLAELRGMRDPAQPMLAEPGTPWRDWLMGKYQALSPRDRPYYLLLVGGPELFPFGFQGLLDSAAAVGRVAFDSVDDLGTYAEKVVRLERTADPVSMPEALFFAPDGGPSDATYFSRRYLAQPLSQHAADLEVDVRMLAGDDATKASFFDASKRSRAALVYTASHGVGARDETLDVQLRVNGAIVCQGDNSFITADDLPNDTEPFLEGAAFFQFACFGYGTPARSDFEHWLGVPALRTQTPFIAALPKRLLAHPRGPIAYIGHVDESWLHGFGDPDHPMALKAYTERLQPFVAAISTLLTVQPVGLALTELNKRADLLNGMLAQELDSLAQTRPTVLERIRGRRGSLTTEFVRRIADTFIWRSDAQNYALLGDPGAKVRIFSS